jgi:hypothetical protein
MHGFMVIVEAAGESDAWSDAELAHFARELEARDATMLASGHHSRYGALMLLVDLKLVGEAFAIALGRFGAAVEFAGLPALPIIRVEVIAWQQESAPVRPGMAIAPN